MDNSLNSNGFRNSNFNSVNNQSYTSKQILVNTTSQDYGQTWINDNALSLQELGENEIKLRYLEKALKSQRRLAQREATKEEEALDDRLKYDKNAVVGKKFPVQAAEYKYPNDGKEKPKSLFIRYNDEYGSKKPNELEMPGNTFINY